jgi:uridine kinase
VCPWEMSKYIKSLVQYDYNMKISICGKMCSGKSTLANKIIEQCSEIYNEKYEKDSFLVNYII